MASQKIKVSLKDKKFYGDGNCSICYEQMEEDNNYEIRECKHLFHTDCIMTWFRSGHDKCPMCRDNGEGKVPEEEDQREDEPVVIPVANPIDVNAVVRDGEIVQNAEQLEIRLHERRCIYAMKKANGIYVLKGTRYVVSYYDGAVVGLLINEDGINIRPLTAEEKAVFAKYHIRAA